MVGAVLVALKSRAEVKSGDEASLPAYVYSATTGEPLSVIAQASRLGVAAANCNTATYIPSLDIALILPSPPKVDVSIVSLATARDFSGSRIRKLISPESLSAIAASVDGSVLAGGGDSGRLYLWETITGRLIKSFPGHFKSVSCLKFSQDGTLLISGGSDGLLRVWIMADIVCSGCNFPAKDRPMASGIIKPFRSWASHSLAVTGIYASVDSAAIPSITSCSKDGYVRVWSLEDHGGKRSIHEFLLDEPLSVMEVHPEENVFFCGSQVSSKIYCVTFQADKSAKERGHEGPITSLRLSPDSGDRLWSGSEDGKICLWDLDSRTVVKTIVPHSEQAAIGAILCVEWPTEIGTGLALAAEETRKSKKQKRSSGSSADPHQQHKLKWLGDAIDDQGLNFDVLGFGKSKLPRKPEKILERLGRVEEPEAGGFHVWLSRDYLEPVQDGTMDKEPAKLTDSAPQNGSWKEMYEDLYQFCLEKILVCKDEREKEGSSGPNEGSES